MGGRADRGSSRFQPPGFLWSSPGHPLFNASQPAWEFWIDVGGTFTLIAARRPDGTLARHKVERHHEMPPRPPARRRRANRRSRAAAIRWLLGRLRISVCSTDRDKLSPAQLLVNSIRPLAACSGNRLRWFYPRSGNRAELLAGDELPVLAIYLLAGLPAGAPIPPVTIRLGTTRGTNASITWAAGLKRRRWSRRRGFGDH